MDVRVIAATSKNLEDEVARGSFREDLFYRLNVFPITLPPLRDRTADIEPLANHFLNRFNLRYDMNVEGIDPTAISLLLRYGWPGNVRELENCIERALVISEKRVLLPENISSVVKTEGSLPEKEAVFEGYSLKVARKELEKVFIARALKATEGNRTRASRLLEISHPSLLSKIKEHDLSELS